MNQRQHSFEPFGNIKGVGLSKLVTSFLAAFDEASATTSPTTAGCPSEIDFCTGLDAGREFSMSMGN
tara:strand:- start:5944 stop:6144 length:201 start_codon:yes stop_codon:yes gene_type:complete